MPTTKKEVLRKKMLAKRKDQNQDLAASKGMQAQNILLAQEFWQNAHNIAIYMPIQAELDTSLLIQNAWASKKNVLLPRCRKQEAGMMDFFPCTNYADLTKGMYNILEPKEHIKPWQGNIDLLILPALAFAKTGHRLGFGAGYYDRFLALGKVKHCVGLVFAWQVIDDTSIWGDWDMQVNAIVSEEGVLWI